MFAVGQHHDTTVRTNPGRGKGFRGFFARRQQLPGGFRPAVPAECGGTPVLEGMRVIFLSCLPISAYGDVAPFATSPYNPAAASGETASPTGVDAGRSKRRVAIGQLVVRKRNRFPARKVARFRAFVTAVISTRERRV